MPGQPGGTLLIPLVLTQITQVAADGSPRQTLCLRSVCKLFVSRCPVIYLYLFFVTHIVSPVNIYYSARRFKLPCRLHTSGQIYHPNTNELPRQLPVRPCLRVNSRALLSHDMQETTS